MAIRECTPSDFPKLVEFWNSNAGWDEIDLDTWKNRFISSPDGNSFVVIAEKEGEIQAQLIFISLRVSYRKEYFSGCRPFAAVIGKKNRGLLAYKFILQLFNFGIQLMRKKSFDFLIMIPDPRWKSLAHLVDTQVFKFPLYKLEVSDDSNFNETGNQIRFIDFDHRQIDSLWEEISGQEIFMINRGKEFLKWKNSHRDYKIIGVFQGDLLIGLCTFLEKERESQILICDLMYRHEFTEQVIQGITDFIGNMYKNDSRFKKIVCLMTESMKSAFSNSGYAYGDYDFYFWVKILNPKIKKESIEISNWYLSAND